MDKSLITLINTETKEVKLLSKYLFISEEDILKNSFYTKIVIFCMYKHGKINFTEEKYFWRLKQELKDNPIYPLVFQYLEKFESKNRSSEKVAPQ